MGPMPGYFWPTGAGPNMRVENVIRAYELLGFETCANGDLEGKAEKIAICATGGFAEHAARQLPSGAWTSKLGLGGEDVEHDALEAVSGGQYGDVVRFLKRAPGSSN